MSQWTEQEREEMLRRRGEGPLMALQLPSASALKFVSKGAVDESLEERETFIASEEFTGSKAGYVFKMASSGLGYYLDRGPMACMQGADSTDGNDTEGAAAQYDMDKHIRGEVDESAPLPPGHGRVGALGDLLAENKAKKQEAFEALVHANRCQPPKAIDEEEYAFLDEKDRQRRAAEAARKVEEDAAEAEFRMAVAAQAAKGDVAKTPDLTKLLGQAKSKKPEPLRPTASLVARLVKRKDAGGGSTAAEPNNKAPRTDANHSVPATAGAAGAALVTTPAVKSESETGAGDSLLGLASYGDSDED